MSLSPKKKLIDGEIAEAAPWNLPSVQIPTTKERTEIQNQQLLTAEAIEELQKQAFAEAHAEGMKAGLQDGADEVNRRLEYLESIIQKLDKPLEVMDEELIEQIVALSISIARQLVRRELKTDPGQIVGVVRETIAALPVAARNVKVMLNPDDASIVREAFSVSGSDQRWEMIEDPVIGRGGCKVITDTSRIDASVETRFAEITAAVFGGERKDDDESQAD